MKSLRLMVIALVALLGACEPATTPTSTSPSTSTTATPAEEPPPTELGYGYASGQTIRYDVNVSQDITFDATGDAPGFGDASLPIDADLVTESTGFTTYELGSRSSPGTFTMDIVARFPETRVAGTVNGATVDNLEEGGVEADLARIEPVDVSIDVTASGEVLDQEEAAPPLGADLVALTGLTNDLFALPVGPSFPAGEAVTVGDRWEVETLHDSRSGPVAARSTSEVIEIIDGLYVIETTTVTDAYQVDFSAEFRDLFLAFAEISEDDEIPADIEESLDSIEFTIRVDESSTTEVARFDPVESLIEQSTKSATMRLTMVFQAPDDTGAVSGFAITLDLAQTAVFTRDR